MIFGEFELLQLASCLRFILQKWCIIVSSAWVWWHPKFTHATHLKSSDLKAFFWLCEVLFEIALSAKVCQQLYLEQNKWKWNPIADFMTYSTDLWTSPTELRVSVILSAEDTCTQLLLAHPGQDTPPQYHQLTLACIPCTASAEGVADLPSGLCAGRSQGVNRGRDSIAFLHHIRLQQVYCQITLSWKAFFIPRNMSSWPRSLLQKSRVKLCNSTKASVTAKNKGAARQHHKMEGYLVGIQQSWYKWSQSECLASLKLQGEFG